MATRGNLKQQGKQISEITAALGVFRRTVYRALTQI